MVALAAVLVACGSEDSAPVRGAGAPPSSTAPSPAGEFHLLVSPGWTLVAGSKIPEDASPALRRLGERRVTSYDSDSMTLPSGGWRVDRVVVTFHSWEQPARELAAFLGQHGESRRVEVEGREAWLAIVPQSDGAVVTHWLFWDVGPGAVVSLGSHDLRAESVLELAALVEPVTEDEWRRAVESTERTTTTTTTRSGPVTTTTGPP